MAVRDVLSRMSATAAAPDMCSRIRYSPGLMVAHLVSPHASVKACALLTTPFCCSVFAMSLVVLPVCTVIVTDPVP